MKRRRKTKGPIKHGIDGDMRPYGDDKNWTLRRSP